MIKNSDIFRTLCTICAIFLTLLITSPLAMLAFNASLPAVVEADRASPPAVATPTQSSPDNAIQAVSYLQQDTSRPLTPGQSVYDVFTVAERHNRQLPTALPEVSPFYGEKVVYLTFDDGPDPENTPKVLNILQQEGVKATFFVIGTQVEKYPDLLRQIYQAGHAIGNHSYDHRYRELYQSAATYMNQLYKNDDLIKNVLGVRPRISRAPGGSAGSFTKEYWDSLKRDGYIEVGWNVSSGDASHAKADQIYANIVSQMEQKFLWSHAIILMHDGRGHAETVKALPKIIKFLKEQGFQFRVVTLDTPPAW